MIGPTPIQVDRLPSCQSTTRPIIPAGLKLSVSEPSVRVTVVKDAQPVAGPTEYHGHQQFLCMLPPDNGANIRPANVRVGKFESYIC